MLNPTLNPDSDLLVIGLRYDTGDAPWGVHMIKTFTDGRGLGLVSHPIGRFGTDDIEQYLREVRVEPLAWQVCLKCSSSKLDDLADVALWTHIKLQIAPVEFQDDFEDNHFERYRVYVPLSETDRENAKYVAEMVGGVERLIPPENQLDEAADALVEDFHSEFELTAQITSVELPEFPGLAFDPDDGAGLTLAPKVM